MRRWAAACFALALGAAGVGGCARSGLTRSQLKDRYIAGLVTSGVPKATASCVIETFFAELTDAQLKSFNSDGTSLTDAQRAEIRRISQTCPA